MSFAKRRLDLMGAGERPPSGAFTPLDYDKPLPPLRTGSSEAWDSRRGTDVRPRHHVPVGSYDGKPLPSVSDSPDAPIQGPRKPNMSLFSLFSRPKVQKLRGYAESGLATPIPRDETNASRADLSDLSQLPMPELPRSESSMSFRTHKTQGSGNAVKRTTARRVSQDHRHTAYDPPPLFQAFARSTKNGLVEISTASPETVMAKSRAKRIGALHMPTEGTPRGSTDTSRSGEALRLGRFASKTSGSINATHVDVERKILVLVSTGHLLQYSEYGPSGRLPEKVLVLGENSAAYASDLINGRPFVAQISQEVDEDGIPVPPAGSLFSKVGIKSSAAKKMISNVLLVLPDGDELNAWLGATRQQIEELGGPKNNQVDATELRSRDGHDKHDSNEPQHDSNPMQRYHIKRASSTEGAPSALANETSVSPIKPSPTAEPTTHSRVKSRGSIEEAEAFADILAAGASYTKPKDIQGEAEAFGDMLAAGASYTKPSSMRGRSPSDAPSATSSVAQSVDNLRLSSLRNSVRMSANTNTTGWTSRTNSLTSEYTPNKQSMESSSEAYGSRGPYRNLSSYGSGPSGKRRSAMPVMPANQAPPPPTNIDLTLQTKFAAPKIPEPTEDSPVTGWNSSPLTALTALPALPPPELRGKALSSRQSMPLLTEEETKHDLAIAPPPPITDGGERPQSFVGELPSSAHWTTKLSPGKRSSKIQPLPTERQMQRMSSAPSLRTATTTPAARTARRKSSQPFTLPLKVNPSGSANSASWQNSRQMKSRPNQQHSPDSSDPETPLPRIVKLQAQVTPTDGEKQPSMNPTSLSQEDNIPHNPPASKPPTPPSAPPPTTKRLSIFPPAQPPLDTKNLSAPRVRPPSITIPTNHHTQKRPISIQIRTTSSPAPFLSSLPQNQQSHSTKSSPQSAGAGPTRSFTPPIRSLKPSRPGVNAFRSRTSLPVLDLGIPVVGLGPPAPPPNAPLPLPPTGSASSRPTSALPRTPREVQG